MLMLYGTTLSQRESNMKSLNKYAYLLLVFPLVLVGATPKKEQSSILAAQALQALQDELKNPRYIKEILPNDFSYLKQLLEYTKSTEQPRTFTRSVFKLFSNLIKGTRYINAYAFSDLLENMPNLLQKSFVMYKTETVLRNITIYELDACDRFKRSVSTLLVTSFNNNYQEFKKNPQVFLDNLSNEILDINEEEVNVELLRQAVIRFLEISLNKLVWSIEDKEESWMLVKKISNQLACFMDHAIIVDVNDLDDLFWTLVHRYSYFLELNCSEFTLEFYEKIKQDIASEHCLLLELEEQDSFVEKKSSFFLKQLMAQEAQQRALLIASQSNNKIAVA